MSREPFRQVLPALDLTIERYTGNVPADGAWYVRQAGQEIGRYRTRAQAQQVWKEIVAESGWVPPKEAVDPRQALLSESAERWARNRAG